MKWVSSQQKGFTIVELLIVIVVIAILAALVVVAYDGMRRHALDSAIQADLKQVVTKVELAKVEGDKYPANLAEINVADADLNGDKVVFNYTANAPDYTEYCVSARASGRTFYATQGKLTPEPGYCNGTTGVASDGTVAVTNCIFTGIALAGNETSQMYTCPVPAGMDWLAISQFTGSGGSGGGAYLYVKRGSAPTTSVYDCRSIASTMYVSQQCVFDAPQAGDYYIFMRQLSSAQTNGTLEVVWGNYGAATIPYQAPYVTVDGSPFSRQSHSYEVSSDTDYLVVSMLGSASATGNYGPSMAIKHGSRPGVGSTDGGATADCVSTNTVYDTDQCTIINPASGTWYIETYAYRGIDALSTTYMGRKQSYGGVRVEARAGNYNHTTQDYTGPVQVSGGAFARESYKITVPAGAASLTVTTAGGTYQNYGAALAVKYGSRPGAGSADPGAGAECNRPTNTGNSNTCTINSPTAGDYYIEVYSYYGSGSSVTTQGRGQSFANTTLTATIN